MKTLKVIGMVLLLLIVVGGAAYGAYIFGKSQSETTVVTTTTDDTDISGTANNNVQPKTNTEPTCNADELTLSVGEGNGPGAGSNSINVVLTNTGDRECSLVGYSGVSLVNANGNQVGDPATRTTGSDTPTVNLSPGKSAKSLVTYAEEGNFDPGTCKDGATKLRVYPPNDYGYLSVATTITSWCPGFTVAPVTAS